MLIESGPRLKLREADGGGESLWLLIQCEHRSMVKQLGEQEAVTAAKERPSCRGAGRRGSAWQPGHIHLGGFFLTLLSCLPGEPWQLPPLL